MPKQTLDEQAKQRVRDAIIEKLTARRASTEELAEQSADAAEVDRDDTVSKDDQYQQEQAGDMDELLDDAQERQDAALEAFESLDFSATKTVRPGAIVGWKGDRMVVGVVLDEVEVAGETYEGLSTDAPLYAELEGKKAGDTVEFNGTKGTIEFVA